MSSFTSKRARLPLRAEEIVCGVCQRLELEHQFMAVRQLSVFINYILDEL
jgi:hypothetical protein